LQVKNIVKNGFYEIICNLVRKSLTMKNNLISRRNFIQKTALTTGMASVAPFALSDDLPLSAQTEKKSLHEVWIAGVSQMGLRAKTPELMIERIFGILEEAVTYKPDFICLPEAFPFEYVETRLTFPEKVEISNKVLMQFSEFSKQNYCYTICPVFTSSEGRIYNSAVVFDRTGKRIGQYNKIHETVGYVRNGITCGALFQPAIQTEFGPVGIQICYDINWEDGWKMLRDQGVKIIFWCSAFDGGQQINMKALQNKCIVASGTNKNVSKVCDMDGRTIATTGIWEPNFYCGKVNMEKVFLPLYDYLKQSKDIGRKYGKKVKITYFHEEEWTIIESLSPDLLIKDIVTEFGLKNHVEGLKEAEIIQSNSRV
jgi:beta-ureidopropionase